MGLVQCACLPAFSMTWMEEGQAWLHLPLPVCHGTPQTSLSFICQQQPVIRIPLPEGPNPQESRCGWLRQQADWCSSCCSTLDTVLTFSQWGGYHGMVPHKQYLFALAVSGICVSTDIHRHSLCFDKLASSSHPSRMPLSLHRDVKMYQRHIFSCCD